jgi:hypothetical protein
MLSRIWFTSAVLAVAVSVALAGTAGAASSRSGAAAASFCSVSKKVGMEIAHLGASIRSASASGQAAGMKQELIDIRRAGPTLKSHAPKKVKPALVATLGFVNLVYSTLSTVHWSIPALLQSPAKAAKIETAAQTADARMAPLKTYYDKVCKFKA